MAKNQINKKFIIALDIVFGCAIIFFKADDYTVKESSKRGKLQREPGEVKTGSHTPPKAFRSVYLEQSESVFLRIKKGGTAE
jgi:hypothetical protein